MVTPCQPKQSPSAGVGVALLAVLVPLLLVQGRRIAAVAAEVTATRAEVRTDVAEVRREVRIDLAELRREVRTDLAEVRAVICTSSVTGWPASRAPSPALGGRRTVRHRPPARRRRPRERSRPRQPGLPVTRLLST